MYLDYYNYCSDFLKSVGINDSISFMEEAKLKNIIELHIDNIKSMLNETLDTPDNKEKIEKYRSILDSIEKMKPLLLRSEFCEKYENYKNKLSIIFNEELLDSVNRDLWSFLDYLDNAFPSRAFHTDGLVETTSVKMFSINFSELYFNVTNENERIFASKIVPLIREKNFLTQYKWFLQNKELFFEEKDQLLIEERINNYYKTDEELTFSGLHSLCIDLEHLFQRYSSDEAFIYAKNFVKFNNYVVHEDRKNSILIELLNQASRKLDEIHILESYRNEPPNLTEKEIKKIKSNLMSKEEILEVQKSMSMKNRLFAQWDGFILVIVSSVCFLAVSMYKYWQSNTYSGLELFVRLLIIIFVIFLVYRRFIIDYNKIGEPYKKSTEIKWAVSLTIVKFFYVLIAVALSFIVWSISSNPRNVLEMFGYFETAYFSNNHLSLFNLVFIFINLMADVQHTIAVNIFKQTRDKAKEVKLNIIMQERKATYFDENHCIDKIKELYTDPILRKLPTNCCNKAIIGDLINIALDKEIDSIEDLVLVYREMMNDSIYKSDKNKIQLMY